MRKYLLIFALLTITLAACRVESNVIIDIREDGSASVGAEVGFDAEFRNIIEGAGVVPEDMLSELPSFGGGDVVPIQRTEGDLTFFGAMSEIEDLSSYDFEGAGDDTFTDFSYEFDGSSARLTATVSADGLGADGGDLPIDISQISADLVSANVIVTMPGRVKEHNADEVRSDGTLVWNVSLTGSTSISATSDLGSSSRSWIWWLVGGGVVVVLVVGGVTALLGSRRKEQIAVAAATAAHEARLTDLDVEPPDADQPETT